MAETLKVLGQVAPSANSPANLYTVPSGKSAVVSKLTLCNQNASAAKARVWVAQGGATTDVKQYVCYDMILPVGFAPAEAMAGFALGAGDVVRVQANMANVSFNVTGSEVG